MDRRTFLHSLGIGCSLAASPLVTPVSFASAPGDSKLVVILLRGGMDGLGAVIPHGDPDYAGLRGALDWDTAEDLDGFFAMHSALGPLMPLWRAGELSFVHAVSTPYRDKRSHFDGQDLLEAGLGGFDGAVGQSRDGWLNRLVGRLPAATSEAAYAIGNDPLAILSGAHPVTRWSPDADLALSPQAIRLAQLVMQDDAVMAAALAKAYQLSDGDGDGLAFEGSANDMMAEMRADAQAAKGQSPVKRMAEFAAGRLMEEASIASFSINGWDTHARQDRLLTRALGGLSEAMLTLRDTLSPTVWQKTTVVAVTEFGRTVRLNGTRGTDHGTGGAMILAGGALRGGRVLGAWPGLAEADLYARRDLTPTRDLRAHLGWLIHGLFGLSQSEIETVMFPGVMMEEDPGLLA